MARSRAAPGAALKKRKYELLRLMKRRNAEGAWFTEVRVYDRPAADTSSGSFLETPAPGRPFYRAVRDSVENKAAAFV